MYWVSAGDSCKAIAIVLQQFRRPAMWACASSASGLPLQCNSERMKRLKEQLRNLLQSLQTQATPQTSPAQPSQPSQVSLLQLDVECLLLLGSPPLPLSKLLQHQEAVDKLAPRGCSALLLTFAAWKETLAGVSAVVKVAKAAPLPASAQAKPAGQITRPVAAGSEAAPPTVPPAPFQGFSYLELANVVKVLLNQYERAEALLTAACQVMVSWAGCRVGSVPPAGLPAEWAVADGCLDYLACSWSPTAPTHITLHQVCVPLLLSVRLPLSVSAPSLHPLWSPTTGTLIKVMASCCLHMSVTVSGRV